MRLYVNRSVFENEAHYFSWFITVANNYLKDRYRSTISHPQEMLSDIDLSQSADGMSDVLDRISTNQLLDILSNSERDILVYKAAGWSCAEIAEKLNITEENAKKRLQRARAKLHSLLEERKNG